jgi:AcrR family transcriptional regulator
VAAKKQVTKEAVLDAARAVVHEEGLGGLSLRLVGRRLGISSPALQWHVGSRDQLLLDLADHVVAGIPLPSPAGMDPADWLRLTATGARAHLLEHAELLPLVRDLASYLPSLVAVKVAIGRALLRSGLEGPALEHAFNAYVGFVFGYTYTQHAQASALSRANDANLAPVEDARRDYAGEEEIRRLLVTAHDVGDVVPEDLEESFTRGVDALLRGMGVAPAIAADEVSVARRRSS